MTFLLRYFCILLVYVGRPDFSGAARTRQASNEHLIAQGLHSVIVNYPRSIYHSEEDWRAASKYNESLAKMPVEEYEKLSRAQDLEDVLLYENWFYGIQNGIIIEVYHTFIEYHTCNISTFKLSVMVL